MASAQSFYTGGPSEAVRFDPGQKLGYFVSSLPASATLASTYQYKAPTAVPSWLTALSTWNVSGGALTLKVYVIPSGGSVSTAYLVWSQSIAANTTTLVFPVSGQAGAGIYIPPGAELHVVGSTSLGAQFTVERSH